MTITDIQPKEITKDCDTGLEMASFGYYDGIAVAKERGLKQTTSFSEPNGFVVCCGDVMFQVQPTEYTDITRRII